MADNKVQVTITGKDETAPALRSAEQGLSTLRSAAAAFGGVLGALGVRALVAQVAEFGKAVVENADKLEKMSQKTAMSVEFLSELQYGAKLADIEIESLGAGMVKFDKAIVGAQQGNSKMLGAFQALGISMKQLKTLSPEAVLLKVMERFGETNDSAAKTAITLTLFGKAGADLIPLLNQGASGFAEFARKARETGNVLDGETAKQAAELHDKLEELRLKAQGAAKEFTAGLTPGLIGVISALDGATASSNRFGDSAIFKVGTLLGNQLDQAAKSFLSFGYDLDALSAKSNLWMMSNPLGSKGRAARSEQAFRLLQDQEQYAKINGLPMPGGKTVSQFLPTLANSHGAPTFDLVASHANTLKPAKSKGDLSLPGSDDTEKRAKARIDLEKAMADQSAMIAAETTKANLAALELEKDQGLITLADYWAQRRKITIDGAQAELDALTKKWEDENKRVQAMPDGTAKTEAKAALLKTQDAVLKKEFEIAAADDQLTAQQIANAQQLADNVTAIQAEINAAKNNSAEVAIAAIHREFDEKRRLMAAAGKDTSGLDEVERMRVAAAEAEIVRRQIDLMYSEMSRKISDIQAKVANRALSEIQAEKDILTVKHQTSVQLDELIAKYQALAAASNDASLIESGRQIHQQNQQLGEDIGETDRALQDSMVNGWSNYFGTILSEGPKAAGGFKGFINSVLGDLDRLIAKMIVVWAWQKILGWISGAAMSGGAADAAGGASVGAAGSAGGGVLGSIDPSMPIGGHAEGGPMAAGEVSWVGERGKELWIPDSSGIVVPNSVFSGGGGRVLGGDQLGGGVGQMSIALSVTSDVDLKIAAASAEWSSKTLRQAVNIVPNVVREQRLRGQR